MITGHTSTWVSSIFLAEFDLIAAAKHGNLEAFNQLVLNYQDRICDLAARNLGDEDAVEDITQNTFLTVYLNLQRFRYGSFRSWLYRIATNACYDVYRQHKRHPVQSIEDDGLPEEKLSTIDEASKSPVLLGIEFERYDLPCIIQHALNQLDNDHRTIVVLVDQQEFDYQETAQILGIPVGAVKSRLVRARMRLQQLLSYSITTNRPLDSRIIFW
jgi:RNA polymerase sigma factor (sigma-70 family)